MKSVTGTEMSKQTVGNAGLYYVCYQLSKKHWNVSITSRNARGVDVIAYSVNGKRKITLQVKTFQKKNNVVLGKEKDILADYLVICTDVLSRDHVDYILESNDLDSLQIRRYNSKYYLPVRAYTADKFRNKWEKIGDALLA